MFGVVAPRPVATRELLADAPRSLAALSHEHPDGWGIALRGASDWIVHRGTACAARCPQYRALVDDVRGELVIAHVRQKTVGATTLANTHPFRRGTIVFAHNGTIKDTRALEARTSVARLAQVEGQTDSERLFAFVLTQIDDRGLEPGLIIAAAALVGLGSASFLLATESTLYAHRLGRTLFTTMRGDGSVTIASERLTAEAWQELPEGMLIAARAGELRVLGHEQRAA